MKVKYELKKFLKNGKLYDIKLHRFANVELYVCQQFECYNPKNRKSITIKKGSIIELNTRCNNYTSTNIKKGLYPLWNYHYDNKGPNCEGYLVSEDQLNAYTIPLCYEKEYDEVCSTNDINCIKIKKKNNPFFVYKSPKLEGEIKKAYYLYIDTILKKMFYSCGEIVLNANMNTILNNVKQFDKIFLENNSMELLMEFNQYLETFYKKIVKLESEHKKIKKAKDYFELDNSPLNEIEYLEELKIKRTLLEMN